MKFYIASSFKLVHIVEQVEKDLEDMGHSITVKWWRRAYGTNGEVKTNDLKKVYDNYTWEQFFSKPEVAQTYWSDFNGIMDADAFIFVAGEKAKKFNGASVELGIALARKIPCYLIGELEPSCLFFPLRKIDSAKSILCAELR